MTKRLTQNSLALEPPSTGLPVASLSTDTRAEEYFIRTGARWSDVLRGAISTGPTRHVDWHLVMARLPGWQSAEDWCLIASHVRDIEPRIEPFIVRGDLPHSYTRRQAAERATLVFSPGRLSLFKPVRGRVYQGKLMSKVQQLRRLAAAGVKVPLTAVLTPELRLDPAKWGNLVLIKPNDLATSSHGLGIQLMRTSRVRFKPRSAYPPGHPGRYGHMLVQQFIDTGDHIAHYRVLTLFGEPLYATLGRATQPRVDLDAPDEAIESAAMATQGVEKERQFVKDPDVLALARAAHEAIPEVPLKGCDIVRDAATGTLYVLEVNAGGNTWHFSSSLLAEGRADRGPEYERQRLEQFDAMRTAARVLVEKTRVEAE